MINIQSLWRGYTIRSQMWYMERFKGTHEVGHTIFEHKKATGTTPCYNTCIHTTMPVTTSHSPM